MKSNKASGWLWATVCLGIGAIISWLDFGLYFTRSEDGVGIALSAVTAIAFTIAAIGFYIQWDKVKRKPEE